MKYNETVSEFLRDRDFSFMRGGFKCVRDDIKHDVVAVRNIPY